MTAFLQSQAVRVDKTPGAGEDSDPLALYLPGGSGIALGVFDGLGGSGARMFTDANGRSRSTAALASDLAARVCEEVLGKIGFVGAAALRAGPADQPGGSAQEADRQAPDDRGDVSGTAPENAAGPGEPAVGQIAGDPGVQRPSGAQMPVSDAIIRELLEEKLRSEFRREAEALEADGPSPIKGTMSRRLPTTACLLVAREKAGARLTCTAFWAGDSRAYLWTGRAGLQQLTQDHVRTAVDALTAVRQDPPMSNFVSPDVDTYLESNQVTVGAPCLLACGSDGAFNYFASPMEFEAALLLAITKASAWEEVVPIFRDLIVQVAQDDVSFVLSGHGYAWERLASDAQARLRNLRLDLSPVIEQRHALKMAAADLAAATKARDEASRRLDGMTETIWARYRHDYEAHQPRGVPALPQGGKRA